MGWGSEVVAAGVDIDPATAGALLPVNGQRVLSPAEAVAFAPDLRHRRQRDIYATRSVRHVRVRPSASSPSGAAH